MTKKISVFLSFLSLTLPAISQSVKLTWGSDLEDPPKTSRQIEKIIGCNKSGLYVLLHDSKRGKFSMKESEVIGKIDEDMKLGFTNEIIPVTNRATASKI
jgi:hypothetical protein